MDITKYDFPDVTSTDFIFDSFDTIPELLKEAKDRGFYNGHTKYNNLFSELFFTGGKLKFKSNLNEDFKLKALPYLKSFMQSFSPSHNEKEAICALLLSEIVD